MAPPAAPKFAQNQQIGVPRRGSRGGPDYIRKRRSAAPGRIRRKMSVANAIGLGVITGIVLFFVLQRLGIIDRWIERFDRR